MKLNNRRIYLRRFFCCAEISPALVIMGLINALSFQVLAADRIESVKIGYLPMVSSLTYFVAVEKGYFLDERLQVDASSIKSSDGLAQELVSNHIDMAVELSITPLLDKIGSSGPQFEIFSTSKIEDSSAFDGVFVKSNSTIMSMADLSGKKVAVFPGTTAMVCFQSVFSRVITNAAMPKFDNQIKPADQLNAIMKGDVDAVHAYEPILTIGVERFGLRRIFGSIYAAQLSPNPIGVAALNKKFVSERPKVAARLLRAMDNAVQFIHGNPEDARAILAKYTGAELGTASKMHIMPMSASFEKDNINLNQYLTILRKLNLYRLSWDADVLCTKIEAAK